MDLMLTDEEARVLGCLIEKKMTTPDNYPLSLNSLINACNQKASRDPVVTYGDRTVLRAVDGLKQKHLLWQSIGGRVLKYKEGFVDEYNLADEEAAIMCVLLLRGAQTVGELRSRSERQYRFDDLDEVIDTLEGLMSLGYVAKMPRQPGQKDVRYTHLLQGSPEVPATQTELSRRPTEDLSVSGQRETQQAAKAPQPAQVDQERLTRLETQVESLAAELEEVKKAFLEFRRQFE